MKKNPVFNSVYLRYMDRNIFYIYLILVMIGIVSIYSVSKYAGQALGMSDYSLFYKQMIFSLVSIVVTLFAIQTNYHITRVFVKSIFVLSLILLLLVFMPGIGVQIGLARRWINMGFFSLNPSEFAKITIIIYLAHIFVKKTDQMDRFTTGLLPPLLLVSSIFFIMLLQSGFSIGAIIIIVMFTMIFAGGASIKYIISIGLLAIPILALAVWKVAYRKERILAYIDPWKDPSGIGYQSIESLRALALGGISGEGLGNSTQKLFRLPASHTDFIFSIFVEETGLIGGITLLTLFFIFFLLGLRLAFRAKDAYGQLLSFGITVLIITHALLNIMINMALLPPTGVSLPFISYGGSAHIAMSLAVGILLNISAQENMAQDHKFH